MVYLRVLFILFASSFCSIADVNKFFPALSEYKNIGDTKYSEILNSSDNGSIILYNECGSSMNGIIDYAQSAHRKKEFDEEFTEQKISKLNKKINKLKHNNSSNNEDNYSMNFKNNIMKFLTSLPLLKEITEIINGSDKDIEILEKYRWKRIES